MSLVILVRHGRTAANAAGILAGRTPGLRLDPVGVASAEALRDRLAEAPLVAAVSSPLDRCRQTADIVVNGRLAVTTEPRLTECDYGEWTGQELRRLRRRKLWPTIQATPSQVTFPGGESFPQMQARAVAAIRDHDAAISAAHGPEAVWIAFSHGDVIKAIITDAVGAPLDHLQRIVVDPCSATAIRYTSGHPLVHVVNAAGTDPISALVRPPADGSGTRGRRRPRHDGVVGGGDGPESARAAAG
jgi:probable phosphomutase (TIGR03848 family)